MEGEKGTALLGDMSKVIVNVFGEEVDNKMLEIMPEFEGKVITQIDRARVAWNDENASGKKTNANDYVKTLKDSSGNGVSTLCLVYNATGDSIAMVTDHDWYGHIYTAPYPTEIGNGQWAAFLHVKSTAAASGSLAGVVYRGRNTSGKNKDYLLCWSTPWGATSNSAYCEIGDVAYFNTRWESSYKKLNASDYSSNARADGCEIDAHTEGGTSPTFTAKITSR